MPGFLGDLAGSLAGWDTTALYVIAGLIAILDVHVVGIVVPAEGFIIATGATVTTPTEFVLLVSLVAVGNLLGEISAYGVGHRWGGSLRTSRLGLWVGDARWRRAEEFLDGAGGWSLVGARFIFAVCSLFPVIAGAVGMRFRRYLWLCVAGTVVWAPTCVGLGTAVGASVRSYGWLGLVGWLVLLATVVIVIVRRRGNRAADVEAARESTDAAH